MKRLPSAVIFDLDGVITQTAHLHFLAWKKTFDEYLRRKREFREFTYDDYLLYVDGKPRYEGVRSFLSSRGIKLSWGNSSDSPRKETICGLGNKKNIIFKKILKKEKPKVYSSTIKLIKELRRKRIKVAVASSSKNCSLILNSLGIRHLFSAQVDGVVSSRLSLKGKPYPDIFLETAKRLKVAPSSSVVIEDASSGVEAARWGGFGLVVGVARKNNVEYLLESGADIAVRDLAYLDIDWIKSWFKRKPFYLFQGLNLRRELKIFKRRGVFLNPNYFLKPSPAHLKKRKSIFFFDYDGTLTPIVSSPDKAFLPQGRKKLLEKISKKFPTVIISGRSIHQIKELVDIENIIYAGVHGLEIEGGGMRFVFPSAKRLRPLIFKIKNELTCSLREIAGILIEDKKFSIAVHYRQVEDKFFPFIRREVKRVLKGKKGLRLIQGKKVLEIIINSGWNKAWAIRWIMDRLGVSLRRERVIYFGDDTTDEDAFFALRVWGAGVLINKKPKFSGAHFFLSAPQELEKFLNRLIK